MNEKGLITLLTLIAFLLIIGSFAVTNNFSSKPYFMYSPFIAIILLALSITISIISYKMAKDEELYAEEGEFLYKLLEAIDISCVIVSVILILLAINIYFM